MTTENILSKVMEEADLLSIEAEKLSADLKELKIISDSLPKDNVFSTDNCLRLERLCIRGMNICDYWCPIIHVVISEKEAERDKIKNKSYIDADDVAQNKKLTAEMRKAFSESNDDYNRSKIFVEKIKAVKLFFERKRDTFKSAIFVFKDQLSSYKISDKGNSGESLGYEKDETGDNWTS